MHSNCFPNLLNYYLIRLCLIYQINRSSDSLENGLAVAFRRTPKSDENTVRNMIGSYGSLFL